MKYVYVPKKQPVSFVKFTEEMIGSYVWMGGISTGTVMCETYIDEWGDTRVDVIWDNDISMRPRSEFARELRIKQPGKNPLIKSMLVYYNMFA